MQRQTAQPVFHLAFLVCHMTRQYRPILGAESVQGWMCKDVWFHGHSAGPYRPRTTAVPSTNDGCPVGLRRSIVSITSPPIRLAYSCRARRAERK